MSEISVFVPSYNHARFVERTLRSIFAQTKVIKKLLVIDDGSTDGSAEIIEKVLKDCPFESELIARVNRGLCATLNEGFSKTSGEFLAYLGSDDLWLPTFLEEQVSLLESRPGAVLAFCHSFVIDENDMIIDRSDNWTAFADGNMLPCLLRGEIFSSPGVVYRRSAVEKIGWNEGAKLEDFELYLNLCAEGEFARNEKLLCAWRRHGLNTSDNFPAMLSEHLAAQERTAAKLGIEPDELERIQRELKFKCVSDYVRGGFKKEAWTLFRENRGGSRSAADTIGTLARLAVPQALFQWNRTRKRRNAMLKYGKLDLDR
jgi:alpha-1,3-rhamnosyltransferase